MIPLSTKVFQVLPLCKYFRCLRQSASWQRWRPRRLKIVPSQGISRCVSGSGSGTGAALLLLFCFQCMPLHFSSMSRPPTSPNFRTPAFRVPAQVCPPPPLPTRHPHYLHLASVPAISTRHHFRYHFCPSSPSCMLRFFGLASRDSKSSTEMPPGKSKFTMLCVCAPLHCPPATRRRGSACTHGVACANRGSMVVICAGQHNCIYLTHC